MCVLRLFIQTRKRVTSSCAAVSTKLFYGADYDDRSSLCPRGRQCYDGLGVTAILAAEVLCLLGKSSTFTTKETAGIIAMIHCYKEPPEKIVL